MEQENSGCKAVIAHLPDVIVNHDHKRKIPNWTNYLGAVLFLDISGFTAITEKYACMGVSGTEQLTRTLNEYMESLVSEMLNFDGDILKFAGDAILCMWECENLETMQSVIVNAMECALSIQNKYGEHQTSVKVVLKVKIGIAAGRISILCLGTEEQCSYVELGYAIEAVNLAENLCSAGGDVVVSPSALSYIQGQVELDGMEIGDTKHLKLKKIGNKRNMPYVSKRCSTSPLPADHLELENVQQRSSASRSLYRAAKNTLRLSKKPSSELSDKKNVKILPSNKIRLTLEAFYAEETISAFRLYIATPVLRKMDDNQPLEYLSEMREVTIMFINLSIAMASDDLYGETLQQTFKTIVVHANKMMGCISKMFLFDKGCTYIVVFGFPGYKHENDSAFALVCGSHIHQDLSCLERVEMVSIGITTGLTYCGVVGHKMRHEYTVIGTKVNMAARLMMYYPNRVVCDDQTYFASNLNKADFKELEIKKLKGLSNVGIIHSYVPNLRSDISSSYEEEKMKPIIGRDYECKLFYDELIKLKSSGYNYVHVNKLSPGAAVSNQFTYHPIVVFEGASGIGRTRMIEHVISKSLSLNFKTVHITLAFVEAQPFCAFKLIILSALNIKKSSDLEEQRMAFREIFFADDIDCPFLSDNLDVFNYLFKLDFKTDKPALNEKQMVKRCMELLLLLIMILMQRHRRIVFIIDDVQSLDEHSLHLLPILSHYVGSIVICSLKKDQTNYRIKPSILSWLCLTSTLRIKLNSLANEYVAPIACQILGVESLSSHLVTNLIEKTMGVPSWVESVLRSFIYEKGITIEENDDNALEALIAPALKFLRPSKKMVTVSEEALGKQMYLNIDAHQICVHHSEHLKYVPFIDQVNMRCVINRNITSGVPVSIKNIIQAKIDNMQEQDVLVLRTASILQRKFPRLLLDHMLQKNVRLNKIGYSVQRLADVGMLTCATKLARIEELKAFPTKRTKVMIKQWETSATCLCRRTGQGDDTERPMRECQFIAFTSPSIQETAYETMLDANRRPLHISAANFLELQLTSCLENYDCNHEQMHRLLFFSENVKEDIRDYNSSLDDQSIISSLMSMQVVQNNINFSKRFSMNKYAFRRSYISKKLSKKTPTRISSLNVEKSLFADRSMLMPSIMCPIELRSEFTRNNIIQSNLYGYKERAKNLKAKIQSNSFQRDLNINVWTSRSVIIDVYQEIADHYSRSGNYNYSIFYMVETVAGQISLGHFSAAQATLLRCQDILHRADGMLLDEDWKKQFDLYFKEDLMRIERFAGEVNLHLEKYDAAYNRFLRALQKQNFSLPANQAVIKQAIFKEKKKMQMRRLIPSIFIPKSSFEAGRLLNEESRCLIHLSKHNILMGNLDMGIYLALRALAKAEEAGDELHTIVHARVILSYVFHLLDDYNYANMLLNETYLMSLLYKRELNPDNITSLVEFHAIEITLKFRRENLFQLITFLKEILFYLPVIKFNGSVQRLFATLAHMYIMRNDVQEALRIFRQMLPSNPHEFSTNQNLLAWCHIVNIYSVLQTGQRLFERVKISLEFCQNALTLGVLKDDGLLNYVISCYLTLYYARNGNFSKRAEWLDFALNYKVMSVLDRFFPLICELMLLETSLIEFSKRFLNFKRKSAEKQEEKQYLQSNTNFKALRSRLSSIWLGLEPRTHASTSRKLSNKSSKSSYFHEGDFFYKPHVRTDSDGIGDEMWVFEKQAEQNNENIRKDFHRLKQRFKYYACFQPRLLHFRAFYYAILQEEIKMQLAAQEALKLAESMKYVNEISWLNLNLRGWAAFLNKNNDDAMSFNMRSSKYLKKRKSSIYPAPPKADEKNYEEFTEWLDAADKGFIDATMNDDTILQYYLTLGDLH